MDHKTSINISSVTGVVFWTVLRSNVHCMATAKIHVYI